LYYERLVGSGRVRNLLEGALNADLSSAMKAMGTAIEMMMATVKMYDDLICFTSTDNWVSKHGRVP